jgi:hypothetical protein
MAGMTAGHNTPGDQKDDLLALDLNRLDVISIKRFAPCVSHQAG